MFTVFKLPFSRAFSISAFARKQNTLFYPQYPRLLYHSSSLIKKMPKERIAIIGSGNWGSAIAKIVGQNAQRYSDYFETEIRMWVFEEDINGRKLTEIINAEHENVKYLPGIKLPKNIIADPILRNAVKDATILVFVHPHQFVKHVTDSLRGFIHPNAKGISLIKGIDVTPDGLALITSEISKELGIEVSILSGANIANEVAREKFCETTIGCLSGEDGELFRKIFHTKYFRVSVVEDVIGVELCGALKNIVAVGAGFIDGLKMGDNTKAAIIRIGLLEMKKFGKTFYGSSVRTQTFFESCGVADLITTCAGGRNRKVAEAFVTSGKSIEQLEKELLNGQKLQGTLTAKEVYQVLSRRGLTEEFPLFTIIYKIIYEGYPPRAIVDDLYDD